MCPARLLPCLSVLSSVLLSIYSVSATSSAHQDGQHHMHQLDELNLVGNNNGMAVPINNKPNNVDPQATCELVRVPMCLGVGYNFTMMPNALGHETQTEAHAGLLLISNLLDHQCSPFLRLYICSVFVPFCSIPYPIPIPPCRNLCEAVKNDCLSALEGFGLTWPQQLNCSGLPPGLPDTDICMEPPKDGGLEPTDLDFKLQVLRYPQLAHTPSPIRVVPSRKCPANTIQSGEDCLTICGSQSPDYSIEDRFRAEVWIAIWSIVTLILTIFSLLTFVLQPKRFRWPARPILYLTACGAISSAVALIRWIAGPYTCSGDSMILNRSYDSCICIGSALIVTYFEIAYTNWWLIFAYVWYLSAAREWSTEAIERISARLHHYVWTSSLLPIIYVLLANAISFNTITGYCQLDSRLLTAITAVIVAVGAMLSILTTRALHRVKLTLLYSGNHPYKLDRLIYRLCIISFGVCVSLIIGLIARHLRNISQQQTDQQEFTRSKNHLYLELVRIGGFCASTCFASLWIVSAKTFRTWHRFITCKGSGGCASWLVENKGQQGQSQNQTQRLTLRPQVLGGGSTKV